MDYGKYMQNKLRENRIEKQYTDLLHIKHIDLPEEIIHTISHHYKYDDIEKLTKEHYHYEVMRELRFRAYYSKPMYKYWKECWKNNNLYGGTGFSISTSNS